MEPTPAPPAPEKPSFLKGKRLSSGIIAGGAAFAMTLAGLGIANAQTDNATPPSTTAPVAGHRDGDHHGERGRGPGASPAVVAKALGMTAEELKTELASGKSIAEVAKEKGVDVSTVVDAVVADAKTKLAERVAAGDLNQAEADAMSANLTERITAMVNAARPIGAPGDEGHKGGGPGGRGGPGGPGGPKADPAAIASVLHMTPAELKAGLESGKSLATIATDRGIAVNTLMDALVADAKAHLAQAVTDGKLTQAQADERSATLPERITDLVNRTPAFGRGPGGPGGEGDRRGPGPGPKPNLDAAATALGLSPDALRTELQAGKSLATIAGDHNVDVNKVIDALVADAKAHLAQAVTDGKLTQAQADERAANLTERITGLVNHTGGPHDGGPGPGHKGDRGPRPADGHADDSGSAPPAQPAVLQA